MHATILYYFQYFLRRFESREQSALKKFVSDPCNLQNVERHTFKSRAFLGSSINSNKDHDVQYVYAITMYMYIQAI